MQNMPALKTSNPVGSLLGKLSLRTKLITAFLAVAVLGGPVVGLIINRVVRVELTRQVGANLYSLARSQALALGSELSEQTDMVVTLGANHLLEEAVGNANLRYQGEPSANREQITNLDKQWRAADAANNDADPLVQAVLSNDTATELKVFREANPDHVEIFVTDKYGANVAATNRTSDYYQADEAWWQAAYNSGRGAIYVGEPEYDESSQTYAVNIALPIVNRKTGEVVGVMRTTYSVSALAQLLASVRFGETGAASLIFPNGELLDETGQRAMLDPDSLSQVKAAAGGYGEFLYAGEQRIVSQAPLASIDPGEEGKAINSLGWTLLVTQDPAEALRPVNVAAQTTLLIGLGALLIAALVAALSAQYLAGPIVRLTAAARQVQAGDLNSQVKVESQDEIGVLAQAFNHMTAQLSNQINTLEQRVEERTSDLERLALRLRVAAEVARDAATGRDLDELLDRAALLIRERFGFYHTGIFMVDQEKEYAILRASPTEPGRQMIASNHRLRIGEQGIVGHAAATGEPRIALDTGADAVYFSNPLLPNTRSEMALPLKSGDAVIGVLDVQSEEPQAFTQDDISVMQIMADQLAIAFERTRLFQQVQQSLNELERTYSQFTEQSWKKFVPRGGFSLGYRYDGVRLEPITEAPKETKNSGDANVAAIPIRLRGQTIGAINVRFQGEHTPQETVALIEQAADRLAFALENARLIEETRQRAKRDYLISELSSRVRSTLDLETVLKTAAQELQKAFQLKEAEVWLGMPQAPQESQDKPKKNGKRRE